MLEETYYLNFQGYWVEPYKHSIPSFAGIYNVYACTSNKLTKTVNLNRLIYIGEADDVCQRILGHNKWPDWRRNLSFGEEICFSAANIVPLGARQRAEAALIFEHKPPANIEYIASFPFHKTTVISAGCSLFIKPAFTVKTDAISKTSFFG